MIKRNQIKFDSFRACADKMPMCSLQRNPRTILHGAAAPAVQAAVKTDVSYQNDTIIVIFFSLNKNKDNAKVALDSFNS